MLDARAISDEMLVNIARELCRSKGGVQKAATFKKQLPPHLVQVFTKAWNREENNAASLMRRDF